VTAWRVVLEARGLGPISINVRIKAVRKLAVEAADNGLLASEQGDPPSLEMRFRTYRVRATAGSQPKVQPWKERVTGSRSNGPRVSLRASRATVVTLQESHFPRVLALLRTRPLRRSQTGGGEVRTEFVWLPEQVSR
jgi:hypothetical protein